MALVAPVSDGVIQEVSASANSLSASHTSDSTALDKDAFMKLLVAQMKYQDPLEPTSNTEYISQFATFSELEQMQNMSGAMEMQKAFSLVGKEVIMKVTSETTGDTSYERGVVDYVQLEGGKAYLSIGGALYSIDDLDTVPDQSYLEAYDLASSFINTLATLPTVAKITISENAATIDELAETYEKMTKYQKTFVATEAKELLEQYVAKLEELREIAAAADGSMNTETDTTTDTESTETDATTDTESTEEGSGVE